MAAKHSLDLTEIRKLRAAIRKSLVRKKRNRRYWCSGCKQFIVRMSDKKTFRSFCDLAGRYVRMRL